MVFLCFHTIHLAVFIRFDDILKRKFYQICKKGFCPKQGKSLKKYALFRFSCKPRGTILSVAKTVARKVPSPETRINTGFFGTSKPRGTTPTLSRSFVAAPFQLGLVWLSVLSTLPPNPSACPRVGVWDKPWDKFANYFETTSPQFRFCPGDKNGLVLRP